MDHQRTYWLCQILGWTAYSAIGFSFNVNYGVDATRLVGAHVLFVLISILLTHRFRSLLRKRQPSVSRLVLLGGVLLISVTQAAVVVGSDVAIGGGPWDRVSVTALTWGMFCATLTWMLLYTRLTEKRRRDEREAQLQLTAKEAELRALQYQTNPHFLFNCRNSIRALVLENPARAQDMLTRLGNILRHNLRGDAAHTVPLESEIGAVADYLALETVRFEERLRVRFEIDPALRAMLVPPMLLQTLVENAVKHGIAQEAAGGDLLIRAVRDDGAVRIDVENTGRLSGSTSGDQLGLTNARQRLDLLYGSRASLNLRHNAAGSVTATLLLPA